MNTLVGPNRNQTRFATTDDKDPERIVQCPYDDVHLVRASRMSRHLMLCRKNFPSSSHKTCCFNAQHVIPIKEYEYHINTCDDKRMIKQDAEKDVGAALVLPTPERYDHLVPDCDEDWDEDATAQPFITSTAIGGNQPIVNNDPLNFDDEYYEEESQMQDGYEDNGQIEIDVVPEKPDNWESMTQAQRKNHKRKYRRQQERLKEAGQEIVDTKRATNPEEWTEKEREIKLKSICSQYAIPGRGGGSFTDYKSILNQYCQKNRLNIPTYREVTSHHQYGGFATDCRVQSEIYHSHAYCKTKKESSHDAAKWALMAMDLLDGEDGKPKTVRVTQTGRDLRVRREGDETRRLMGAGYIGPSVDRKVVRQAQPQPTYQPHATGDDYYDYDDEYEDSDYPPQNNSAVQSASNTTQQSYQATPANTPAWGNNNFAHNSAPAISTTGGPWNSIPSAQPIPPNSGLNRGQAAPNNSWGAGRPSIPVSRPPPGFPALPNGVSKKESMAARFGRGVTISQPKTTSPASDQAQESNSWQSVGEKKRGFGRGRGTTLAKSVPQ